MLGATPLADQYRPWTEAHLCLRHRKLAACGGLLGDALQQAYCRRFEAASGLFLKPIRERLNYQRGTELRRRGGTEAALPLFTEFFRAEFAELRQGWRQLVGRVRRFRVFLHIARSCGASHTWLDSPLTSSPDGGLSSQRCRPSNIARSCREPLPTAPHQSND